MPIQEEMKLIGYVIVDSQEGVKSLRCAKSVKIERDYVNGGSKVTSHPCHLRNIDGKCQEFELDNTDDI
jgi:hypothetical protein